MVAALSLTDIEYLSQHISSPSDGLTLAVKRVADALSSVEARNEVSTLLASLGPSVTGSAPEPFKTQVLRLIGNACFDHGSLAVVTSKHA
jgi:hypothetical protein